MPSTEPAVGGNGDCEDGEADATLRRRRTVSATAAGVRPGTIADATMGETSGAAARTCSPTPSPIGVEQRTSLT